MPQYDVFPDEDGDGFLLDVQTDFLDHLNTRIVVPLRVPGQAPKPAGRLNPLVDLAGVEHVMVTQFLGAVPVSVLNHPVASLRADADRITAALDFLTHGF